MSQMPAVARTDTAALPASRRPSAPGRQQGRAGVRTTGRSGARAHLRVVTAARPPRRMPFVVLCSVVLAAGLLAVLLLNLQLARGAYALHDLQRESVLLGEQEGQLREQLDGLEAPGVLAQRATELGMVPGSSPAFLRLPDGQVLGVPQAAATAPAAEGDGTDGASSGATPSAKPSAKPSATPSAKRSGTASPTARAERTATGRSAAGSRQSAGGQNTGADAQRSAGTTPNSTPSATASGR